VKRAKSRFPTVYTRGVTKSLVFLTIVNHRLIIRSMRRLSLSLFGSPLIKLDGTVIAARLPLKAQALLAYLAIEADRPQRREALAALFWPDLSEEAGRNDLRQVLHLLRRALGESSSSFLCATPQTAQFNLASDHWMDIEEFTLLISACEKHEHRYRSTCPVCAQRLQRATELYRGELISGLCWGDSVAFEEWVLVKREQFARMALGAWHSLAEYYARCGDYEHMEEAARQQIAIEPFHEDAQRQIMQALAWRGQRNAALAHYATYRKLLEKELGVQPEAKTVALCEQIQSESLS
jgi:DNA-binding SARP family transcriptional activator